MSHRGNLTERMAVIPLLLAARPHSQRELAIHFGVNTKTIRRDVDILSGYYPIVLTREEKELRYSYSDGYEYHPPSLTPAELAALLLAQESIAATALTTAGSPFAKYGQSLLAKVRASLPAILREKLDGLATILGSATVPAKDFTPYSAIIDCLTKAAVECRGVILNYYTLARAATTERKVEPYCIYFDPDGATLKLVGFDHYRGRVVPFAIDHIRSIKETDETFERPADFNLREYLTANCFNGIHGEPVTVRLRARGVTARIFAERMFHPSQRIIDPLGPDSLGPRAASRPLGRGNASEPRAGRRHGRANMHESEPRAVAGLKGEVTEPEAVATGSTRPMSQVASPHGVDEETTTIEIHVAGGRGLVRFILGWGPDVKVLSPPELRDEIAEAHRRALSIYSTSSD
jgi:predicted DNA-binding transcriptional regulator YafY